MDKEEEIAKLQKKIEELESRIENDAIEIARWKDLYFSEKDRRYGRKSESDSVPKGMQKSLFDEMENTIEGDTQDSDPDFSKKDDEKKKTIVKSHSRIKGKRASLTLPANAPVIDIYHEVEKTNCEICNAELTEIGEFVEDKVTFVPARYVVVRHHRKQQRCLNCLPL
ncbi:MAG: IS66 family transposase zinc-finger binding domain-containing protein [Spirochaetaceae bacterium]|nr:IS66 family transposase zinc-finger binding domain-containing protein [Spirochaetaceae bacterium]